jgi:hypothetical protein
VRSGGLIGDRKQLLECSVFADHGGTEMGRRYFRTRLPGDREERWAIYEMWIRGYDNY